MKKLSLSVIAVLAVFVINAQGRPTGIYDPEQALEITRSITVTFAFSLLAAFIIFLVRMIFDFMLKRKIIDRGIDEKLAVQFLNPVSSKSRSSILKWICLLIATGCGLLVTDYLEYGLHSIAIMIFSVAAGLLAYYLLTKEKL